MRWERLTSPAGEPLSLAQAKSHLRVDHDADDADIQSLIKAAREWCEDYTGRAYGEQVWRLIVEPPRQRPSIAHESAGITLPITLPRPPFVALEAIEATYQDGTKAPLDLEAFEVLGTDPAELHRWTALPGGLLRLVVRYRTGQEAPERVKQAMRLLLAHWYENREATTGANADLREPDFGVTRLLDPLREARL